jgi:hypothetical protein
MELYVALNHVVMISTLGSGVALIREGCPAWAEARPEIPPLGR